MSYLHNSSTHTFEKCQKILTMFQQIGNSSANKKTCGRPISGSKHKATLYYLSQSTAKKSHQNNKLTKNSDVHKSALKSVSSIKNQYQNQSVQRNSRESLMFRQKSNSSFVSSYKKQSRLDQIMKLKVNKPSIQSNINLKSNKKAIVLNTSLSSLNSSRSSLNKENRSRNCNQMSRLQKIMNIKVQKPNINSTLIGYEPKKCDRSLSKSISKKNFFMTQSSSVLQLKQCKKKLRKSQQIDEKEDRLWRLFQRQREQQQKQRRQQQQSGYKLQRRKQQKFQKLVQKQLKKIENSRQTSLRKQGVFAQYVYPAY